MSSIYDAHPLRVQDSTNIRLVEVFADPIASDTKSSNPISCRLQVVSLEDDPVYMALSYVWGDEGILETILLDGQPYKVRRNLFDFLTQWRRTKNRNYLWIDALSIDQSCLQERNHQVALMGQVYSNARLVIAWLGSGYGAAIYTVKFHSTDDPAPEDWNNFMTSMNQLSSSEYWARLWIIQEFILAKDLELWSDSVRADSRVLDMHDKYSSTELHAPHLWSSMTELYECRLKYHDHGAKTTRALSSRDLLVRFCFAHCSDTRDRIYGLLGLVKSRELKRHPIHPDYSKTSSALFIDLWERQMRIYCDEVLNAQEQGKISIPKPDLSSAIRLHGASLEGQSSSDSSNNDKVCATDTEQIRGFTRILRICLDLSESDQNVANVLDRIKVMEREK